MNFKSVVILSGLNTVHLLSASTTINAIEVGCMFKRDEGLSTFLIAQFLHEKANQSQFFSIEKNFDHITACQKILNEENGLLTSKTEFLCGDSLKKLPEALQKIERVHFALLDGDGHPEVCLCEFEQVIHKLSGNGLILVDDVQEFELTTSYGLPRPFGKATMILPWMVLLGQLKARAFLKTETCHQSLLLDLIDTNRIPPRFLEVDYLLVGRGAHRMLALANRVVIEQLRGTLAGLRDEKIQLSPLGDYLEPSSLNRHVKPKRTYDAGGGEFLAGKLGDLFIQGLYRESLELFPDIIPIDFARALYAAALIDEKMRGRHCGELRDKISQYLAVAQHVRETGCKEMLLMEIGVLFGGGCLMKLFGMRDLGLKGKIVCIDPFTGYYGQELDRETGLPVTEDIFLSNVEKFGFSRNLIDLRCCPSRDSQALQGLAENSFGVVSIDGDHTYSGVKADWERVKPLATHSGVVLIDDSVSAAWPEVNRFTTELKASLENGWVCQGTFGTTCVLAKDSKPRRLLGDPSLDLKDLVTMIPSDKALVQERLLRFMSHEFDNLRGKATSLRQAEVALKQQHPEQAVSICQNLLIGKSASAGERFKALLILQYAFQACGRRNEMGGIEKDLFSIDPNALPVEMRAELYYQRAWVYRRAGNSHKAYEEMKTALAEPVMPHFHRKNALQFMVRHCLKNKKLPEAEKWLISMLSVGEQTLDERHEVLTMLDGIRVGRSNFRVSEPESMDQTDGHKQRTKLDPSVGSSGEQVNEQPNKKRQIVCWQIGDPLRPHETIVAIPQSERIATFRGAYQGHRAFIIGNGPSLNKHNLSLLRNEITFGVNSIFYKFDEMGFKPTFYVVEDKLVAEDRGPEISRLAGMTKIFGRKLSYAIQDSPETIWLNVVYDFSNYKGFPHFSEDATKCLWVGGTVSYLCMQLAYFMGIREVYLTGFDHHYEIPADAKINGTEITSASADPNHFHPEYFGEGKRWHDPRLDRMELAYRRAKEVFESDHGRILNATVGGYLEVFDRVDYSSLFEVQPIAPVKQPKIGVSCDVIEPVKQVLTAHNVDRFSHLVLDYTRRCNSRCTYCSIWEMRGGPELSLKAIEALLAGLSPHGLAACYLTGGEPYLTDKVIDIGRLIKEYIPKCRVTGATNAIQADQILRRLEAIARLGLALEVHVSINGSEKVHDLTRGRNGNWRSAVKLITALKGWGIRVVASMSIMPQTLRDLPLMQEFCLEKGVDLMFSWVRFSPRYGDVKRAFSGWPEALLPQLRKVEYLPDFFDCPGLSRRLVATPEGDLYPCEVYHPNIRLGNFFKDNLAAILSSERTAAIDEMIRAKGCHWCQGSGMAEGNPKWMLMDCYRRSARQKTELAKSVPQAALLPPGEARRVIEDILKIPTGVCIPRVHSNKTPGSNSSVVAASPRISVVVCTYRNPERLKLTLESIMNQNLPADQSEIIVIDNNSCDSTPQVVTTFSRVRYFQEPIQGLSHARNKGLAEARGEIVAFIDDDAEAAPDWLEALLQVYDSNPDVYAAGGKSLPIWESEKPEWITQEHFRSLSLIEWGETARPLSWPERIIGVNCSFRKTVFREIGMFDTQLGRLGSILLGSEDTEIQRRIHEIGKLVYYTPSAVVFHHVPAERMTREYFMRRSDGHKISEKIIGLTEKREEGALTELSLRLRHQAEVEHRINDLLQAGSRDLLKGSRRNAEQIFLGILAEFPDCLPAFEALGKMYLEADPAKAIEHYRAGVEHFPENRSYRKLLAGCLMQKGEREEALTHFVEVMKTDPRDTDVLLQLGILCKHLSRLDEARFFFETLLNQEPGNQAARRELGLIETRQPAPATLGEKGVERWCPEGVQVLAASEERLKTYKDRHRGQRCVIIGNGPSLNRMDLSFLEREISFGVNRIYLLFERCKFRPSYYVAINPLVLAQSAAEIRNIAAPKFLSHKGVSFFPDVRGDWVFLQEAGEWAFSKDPCYGVHEGWTVTFVAMQLAYYMGFEEVVLIGVDHHFAQNGKPNQTVVAAGADQNHFHPEYFGKGVRWNYPDLKRSAISYQMAKEAFESDGRRILDATVDGRLTVFSKVDYQQQFRLPFCSVALPQAPVVPAPQSQFPVLTERSNRNDGDECNICKVCNSEVVDYKIAFNKKWFKCTKCEFLQAEISANLKNKLKAGEGFRAGTGAGGGGFREYFLSQMCIRDLSARRILLYGTGNTKTLESLLTQGVDAYGCDYSQELIVDRKNKFGEERFFHPDEMPKILFDAIVAVEVVEHFDSPFDQIGNLMRCLTRRGVLTGTTDFWDRSDIRNHIYIKSDLHIAYWSNKSLTTAANIFGYNSKLFELICPGSVKPDEKFKLLWPRKRVFFLYPDTHKEYFIDLYKKYPILPIDKP